MPTVSMSVVMSISFGFYTASFFPATGTRLSLGHLVKSRTTRGRTELGAVLCDRLECYLNHVGMLCFNISVKSAMITHNSIAFPSYSSPEVSESCFGGFQRSLNLQTKVGRFQADDTFVWHHKSPCHKVELLILRSVKYAITWP